MKAAPPNRPRRAWLLAAPALLLGCGGGGNGDGNESPTSTPLPGRTETRIVRARTLGVDYGVQVYVPLSPSPATLPLLVVLDGETWFDAVARASEAAGTPVLVAAVNSVSRRDTDYVPPNSCTTGGGGQAAYLAFLRDDLLPALHAGFGGDPQRRALFGHSHGGGFVLWALLAEAAGAHTFRDHIACDASLGCYPDTALSWLAAYAARERRLPVRLHLSHASAGNVLSNRPWAEALQARAFDGLAMRTVAYTGSHTSIVPQALADALAWLRG